MKRFERYHPLMTPHYTLDWLTTFSVKDIFALRQDKTLAQQNHRSFDTELTKTVHYVNGVMRQVMNDQALIWGIRDRQTNDFVGIFELRHFNVLEKSAELHFELLPHYQKQQVIPDILTYMNHFAFEELQLHRLKAILYQDQDNLKQLLTANGFKLCEDLAVLSSDKTAKLAIFDHTFQKA